MNDINNKRYILITLIILLFYYIYKSYYSTFDNITYNKLNINLFNSLYKYILKLNLNQIKFKTNNNILTNNKKIVYKFYINNIKNFTNSDKIILKKYIYILENKYLKKYNIFKKFKWNFIKISNTLEKSMPFTLDKYIFISDNFINKLKNNKMIKYYCTILLHEKIHILQRFNKKIFKSFYINKLKFYYYPFIILNKYWKRKILSNPDGQDINWIYIYKKNFYLPLLIHNNNHIKEIIIQLYKTKENYLVTSNKYKLLNKSFMKKIFNINNDLYHPNEITANILSNLIINHKYKFLNSNFINILYLIK